MALTNPLRIRYTVPGGSTFQDIIEMSAAEIKTILAYSLCVEFATDTTTNLQGTLNIGGTGTSIGTFTDTRRPDPVNSPVAVNNPSGTTTTSTVYTLKQLLTAGTASLSARLVCWDTTNNRIIQYADADYNGVLDTIISDLAAGNQVGQYQLKSSGAPAGGTWTSRGTFTDKTDDSTGNTTTTYTLWQKTALASPPTATTNIPLKWNGTDGLTEMSSAEMISTTMLMRNRIVNVGTVAMYSCQTTAPVTGTWVQMGDTVTDVIQDRQLVSGYFNIVTATVTGAGGTVKLWIRTV